MTTHSQLNLAAGHYIGISGALVMAHDAFVFCRVDRIRFQLQTSTNGCTFSSIKIHLFVDVYNCATS